MYKIGSNKIFSTLSLGIYFTTLVNFILILAEIFPVYMKKRYLFSPFSMNGSTLNTFFILTFLKLLLGNCFVHCHFT